jgi:NADH oxidase (H2O-forming)
MIGREDNKVIEVTPDVKWIGILDFDIVTFDVVMETKYGTTYNSYFINAEKKTIIETAKEKFTDAYLAKVRQVTDPSEIQYIVLDHTEPDHSGALKHLLDIAPNATVVGSGQALNYLQDIMGRQFKSLKVKDGDMLDLGNKTLKFIGAPNLHWPDSIYTYLVEDKVLFTCDSFGAHYCDEAMFDDLTGNYDDAFTYYFDVILKPFSKFMVRAIEKIRPLDINIICTGHGPILRNTWRQVVDKSEKLAKEFIIASGDCRNNVLITYVSAYGFTKEMAIHIKTGILESGDMNVDIVDIENILLGDLDQKLTHSNAMVIGSPTINQNTLLPIYKLFAMINPIRDRGKLATAFGSYGWSGEAVKIIEANLRALKLNVVQEGLATKFFPHHDKVTAYIEFGKRFGEQLLQHRVAEAE